MRAGTEQRRLAAIVFTDMVGYTAMAQRNEALSLQLLEEHRQIVRGLLPAHGGREVKTMGDGFLLEFPSALAAAQCAVEIQAAIHQRNNANPSKTQILLRIGIHVGDVISRESDIYGDGVNIASRLEPLAAPGGICVSDDVARQIRNKLSNPLTALGPADLKNINLATVVHRVVMPWDSAAPINSSQQNRLAWIVAALLLVGLLCGGVWFLVQTSSRAAKGAANPQPSLALQPAVTAATSSNSASEFPRDPDLRRAWDLVFGINTVPENFSLAEDIVKNVVARKPTDPEAAIVNAWLNDSWINRGWDVSDERHLLARNSAERALQLAPDHPEALAALGQFLSFRGADLPRAEELLRRAISLNPHEPRFYRALAYNVLNEFSLEKALVVEKDAAVRFPKDPLIRYEMALLYRRTGDIEAMDRLFSECLDLAPIASAMLWKGWMAAWWSADVGALKMWLDRVPANFRMNDRVVIMRYEYANLANDPAEALQALDAFPAAWLRDFWYNGPKALLTGDLLALQGKPDLARLQYEAALVEISREKARTPGDLNPLSKEVWVLMGLGRKDDALALHKTRLSALQRPYNPPIMLWWRGPIRECLLLDDRQTALALVKEMAGQPYLRHVTRNALRIDPRMKPWAADAEIQALIAEPRQEKSGDTSARH